jgi:hypothetical protein
MSHKNKTSQMGSNPNLALTPKQQTSEERRLKLC